MNFEEEQEAEHIIRDDDGGDENPIISSSTSKVVVLEGGPLGETVEDGVEEENQSIPSPRSSRVNGLNPQDATLPKTRSDFDVTVHDEEEINISNINNAGEEGEAVAVAAVVHLRLPSPVDPDVADSNGQPRDGMSSEEGEEGGEVRVSSSTAAAAKNGSLTAAPTTPTKTTTIASHSNLRVASNGQDCPTTPPPRQTKEAAAAAASLSRTAATNYNRRRKRPRGRVVRMVSVVDEENSYSATAVATRATTKSTKSTSTTATTTTRKRPGLALPSSHYECMLFRRAVRKWDPDSAAERSKAQQHLVETDDNNNNEEYGDVSLGMKLTVIGGKVIVQKLNALQDGRASPAQLARLVQRGDVLLSINEISLVNLPIDQLMKGLSPLSTPDSNGLYPRELRLRFAAGEGLAILDRPQQQDAANASQDGASDMFNLFPMVDQLSGMPLFEKAEFSSSQPPPAPPPPGPTTTTTTVTAPMSRKDDPSSAAAYSSFRPLSPTKPLSLDERISSDLARDRRLDRDRFVSEFFAWSEDASTSELLRGPLLFPDSTEEEEKRQQPDDNGDGGEQRQQQPLLSSPSTEDSSSMLTLNQFIERGRRAVIGARALSDKVEIVDRGGKDRRSLKSWKTTLSLYSHRGGGASNSSPDSSVARLRTGGRLRGGASGTGGAYSSPFRLFDSASLPVNFGRLEEEEEEDDDDDSSFDSSSYSGDEEPLDGDARLIHLAANDEVWRKQVIQFLEKVTKDREQDGKLECHIEEEEFSNTEPNMDAALSTELGTFLFGESMSKILTQHKKPNALPPEEITAILYDLTTNISVSIPCEIAAASGTQGSNFTAQSPRMGNITKPPAGGDVQLAAHFLLNEALPEWLKSFRPLPWDQRRILWPLDKPGFGGSITASSTLSDDSFTLESGSTHPTGVGSPRGAKRKNLRERIEDQELKARTRVETCFLVTYYFTQKLLPRLQVREKNEGDSATIRVNDDLLEEALTFVRTFGAYLKLHTSLAHAASFHEGEVIDVLLDLARHDPRHKELMKYALKPPSLVFYEPTMLSSLVQRLKNIKGSFAPDQWLATIDLSAASFPDVRPWQVRRECMWSSPRDEEPVSNFSETRDKGLEDLYYIYLTHLLHPMDGHDLARKDIGLVREWCELSIRSEDHGTFKERAPDRRRNFFAVAERMSGEHVFYARDLVLLLQLSREIGDSELELDIAGEILEGSSNAVQGGALSLAVEHLRVLATKSLESFEDRESPSAHKLRRILHIYQEASSCLTIMDMAGQMLHVPTELLRWISCTAASGKGGRRRTLKLVRFLADEADPTHVLEATHNWTSSSAPFFEVELLPVLQTALFRAANQPKTSSELSGVLYKLRRARQRLKHGEIEQPEADEEMHQQQLLERHIWTRMSSGMVPVFK